MQEWELGKEQICEQIKNSLKLKIQNCPYKLPEKKHIYLASTVGLNKKTEQKKNSFNPDTSWGEANCL